MSQYFTGKSPDQSLFFHKKLSCFPNFLGPYKGGRSNVLNKQHNKIFDGDKYAVLESGHLDKKIAEPNIKKCIFPLKKPWLMRMNQLKFLINTM